MQFRLESADKTSMDDISTRTEDGDLTSIQSVAPSPSNNVQISGLTHSEEQTFLSSNYSQRDSTRGFEEVVEISILRRFFPSLSSAGDGISPSLKSSDALLTTGSFCMLDTATTSPR